MRILLISAYEASSHKAWSDTLMTGLNQHEWTYLSLPARHFAWRIRGNAMSFAFDPQNKPTLDAGYDLVIATSMTDVVGLKAFCPALQSLPWLLYFHENQFAYPANDKQQGLVEMQMVTLYSALAADQCVFNSVFNKHTFFAGARALLKKLPDFVSPSWLDKVESKADVLPVPLEIPQATLSSPFAPNSIPNIESPIKLVWSARWEFDKGPERLFAILKELQRRGVKFEIAILGEQFRTTPPIFAQIHAEFSDQISQFGFAPSRADYLSFLSSSHMVLSTALHEFQGLSVLEAVALGCLPVLPNRQVYPELFEPPFLYQSHIEDIAQEAKGAVDRILELSSAPLRKPDVAHYYAENLLLKYDVLLQQLTTQGAS
ncbi:DUF3524 domain-containing protein [Marinomonas sp. A79]|uniref:tRNA-queuosine alpha-mannosyltransferase n=1 Tax=Marinomonas vulgaris TaxID=2823372 RepID=A0ABS5H972_9GAMM|nr:DUF3524 domain-containing protein [Marinomonas vulgaris]